MNPLVAEKWQKINGYALAGGDSIINAKINLVSLHRKEMSEMCQEKLQIILI
jgi:hypothetical protein